MGQAAARRCQQTMVFCVSGPPRFAVALGEEPIEVSATLHSPDNDPRFTEVESTVSFTLRLPSGIVANCATSYSLHEHRNLRVLGVPGQRGNRQCVWV
jgi:hypothetical protein